MTSNNEVQLACDEPDPISMNLYNMEMKRLGASIPTEHVRPPNFPQYDSELSQIQNIKNCSDEPLARALKYTSQSHNIPDLGKDQVINKPRARREQPLPANLSTSEKMDIDSIKVNIINSIQMVWYCLRADDEDISIDEIPSFVLSKDSPFPMRFLEAVFPEPFWSLFGYSARIKSVSPFKNDKRSLMNNFSMGNNNKRSAPFALTKVKGKEIVICKEPIMLAISATSSWGDLNRHWNEELYGVLPQLCVTKAFITSLHNQGFCGATLNPTWLKDGIMLQHGCLSMNSPSLTRIS